jgi:uncharacterized membrane protein YesL
MFPVHVWLPKAHPVAPSPGSALLSGILTKVGVYGIIMTATQALFGSRAFGLLIFTLGLVTMFLGALLALFSVNLKAVRKEEGSVFRDYWNAFRENFPQGTKLWALAVLIGAVFAVDFLALGMLDGTVVWVLRALLGALLVVYLTVLPWVFGYNARFADTGKTVLKNSLLLAGSNMAVSLAMLCCGFLAAFVSIYSLEIFLRAIFLWLVLGFAAVNYLQAFLLRRVFDKL